MVEGGYHIARSLARSHSKIQSFSILQEGKFFALQSNDVTFARLNKALSGAFESLCKELHVHLLAYVQTDDLQKACDAAISGKSPTVPLEINICGLQADAERVGIILSNAGTYLQYPRYGVQDYEYYNPHIFRVEGFSDQVQFEAQESSRPQASSGSRNEPTEEAGGSVANVVSDILDSLTHSVTLPNVSIDSRIKSTLLK